MGMLNLEITKAPSGMRRSRLLAFFVDFAVVLFFVFLVYRVTGEPDFYQVKAAMEAAEAAGGTDVELTNAVFTSFNHAYRIVLLVWFFYEVVTQFALKGSTLGKYILGLRVQSKNPDRKWIAQMGLLCVRSGLKMLSLYFFQGFPFIICNLTIFTNSECCSGFDLAVKTQVESFKQK